MAAQREQMVLEYKKGGVSLSKLAKKYGVSRVSVFYWVDRARNQKMNKFDWTMVVFLSCCFVVLAVCGVKIFLKSSTAPCMWRRTG